LILIGSFIGYARLKLLSKRDLSDLLKAFIPAKLLDEAYRRHEWMAKLLFGE